MFSSFIFISLFCFIYFFSSPFLTRIFVDRIPAMETRGGGFVCQEFGVGCRLPLGDRRGIIVVPPCPQRRAGTRRGVCICFAFFFFFPFFPLLILKSRDRWDAVSHSAPSLIHPQVAGVRSSRALLAPTPCARGQGFSTNIF